MVFRIDSPGSQADVNGAGKRGFVNGDVAADVRGTLLDEAWLNMLQEELAAPIEASGGVLIKGLNTQLLDAIRRLSLPIALSNWSGMVIFGSAFSVEGAFKRPSNGRVLVWTPGGASSELRTSDDGGNSWTNRTKGATASLFQMADSGSVLVSGSSTSGNVHRSTDGGNTWAHSATSGLSQALIGCVWVPTLNLFVGGSSTNIYTSPDGLAWTLAQNLGVGEGVTRLIWTGTAIIGVSAATGKIWRSTNGTLWTSISYGVQASVSATRILRELAVNNVSGRVIAVGYDSTDNTRGIATISDDHGLTWSPATALGGGLASLNLSTGPLPSTNINARAAGGLCCDGTTKEWCMFFDGGSILTSNDDGETWQRRVVPFGNIGSPAGSSGYIASVLARRCLAGFTSVGNGPLASLNRS